MSPWQIALLVLAALLSLLLIPIGGAVRVERGEIKLWVRVGFIRFRLRQRKKTVVKEIAAEPVQESKPKPDAKGFDWRRYIRGFDDVLELISLVWGIIRKALRTIRIGKLRLTVTVATPDAAGTALLYGRLNMVTAMALPVLYEYMRVRNDRIRYLVDFQKDKMEYTLYLSAATTPAAILELAAAAVFAALRYWWPRRSNTAPIINSKGG